MDTPTTTNQHPQSKPTCQSTDRHPLKTINTVSLLGKQYEDKKPGVVTFSTHQGTDVDISNSRVVQKENSLIDLKRRCLETREGILKVLMPSKQKIKPKQSEQVPIDRHKLAIGLADVPFDSKNIFENRTVVKESCLLEEKIKEEVSNGKSAVKNQSQIKQLDSCSVSGLSDTECELEAAKLEDVSGLSDTECELETAKLEDVTTDEILPVGLNHKGETFTSFEEIGKENKSILNVETLVNAHLNEIENKPVENDLESVEKPEAHIAECINTGLDCEDGIREDVALDNREITVCTNSLLARNSLANSNTSFENTQEENYPLHNVNEDFWQKNCDKGQVEDSALVSTSSNPEKDMADTAQREPMTAVMSGVAGGGYKEAASETGSLSAEESDEEVEHKSPTCGDDRDVQISKGSVQSLKEDGIISSVGTTEKDITPHMETLQYRIERGNNPQPASCNLHEIGHVNTPSFGVFCCTVLFYLPIIAGTFYTDSLTTFLLFLFMIARQPEFRYSQIASICPNHYTGLILQAVRIIISHLASALTIWATPLILFMTVLPIHCSDDDSPFCPDSLQPLSGLLDGDLDSDLDPNEQDQDQTPTNHHVYMQEADVQWIKLVALVLTYTSITLYVLSKDWLMQRLSLLHCSCRRGHLSHTDILQEILIDDNRIQGPIPDRYDSYDRPVYQSRRPTYSSGENEGEIEEACGGYRNQNSPRYSDSGIGTIYNFPSLGTTQTPVNSNENFNFHQHPQSTVLCTLPSITPPSGSSLFDVQPEVDSDQHTRRHLVQEFRIVDQNLITQITALQQNSRRNSSPAPSRDFDEHSRRSHSADHQSRALDQNYRNCRSPEDARYRRQTLFWRRSRSHDDTLTRRPQRVDYHRGHSLPAPSTVFTFDKGHDLASVSSAIVEDPSVRDAPTDSRYAVITIRHEDSHGHCYNQATVHCPPDCTIEGILPQVTSKIREQFLRGRDAASVSLHLVLRPVTACRLSQEQPQSETQETTDHGPEVCVASWEDPGITLHTSGGDTVPVPLLQGRLEEEVGADGRVFIARELTREEDTLEWKGPISEDESGFTGGVVKDLQTDNHDDTDDDSEPENFARGFGSYFKRR